MAGVKISNLPVATTPLAGTESIPIVQGGVTARATAANVNAVATYTATGVGAVSRLVSSKLGDVVSVKDFGAVGDGVTDDTAAITTAIAAALAAAKCLFFPAGTYKVTSSLSIPNNLTIEGEGSIRTSIKASTTSFPVMVNTTTTNCRDVTIGGIKLKSGSYGIDFTVSSTQSNWHYTDVVFEDQATAAIRCNQMFLLNSFIRCIFDTFGKCILVSAANSNLNTFYDCEFIELAERAIDFKGGSEANTWIGCRFEARHLSITGKDVIALEAPKCNKFIGCYFEDVFINILRETGSTNTTEFDNCRFSGQETAQAEVFISDGIVSFNNNQFNAGSNGAGSMFLKGFNSGLKTQVSNVWHHKDDSRIAVETKKVSLASSGLVKNLFTFTRNNSPASGYNRQVLAGWLTVMAQGETTGGTECFITKRYPILIRGFANQTVVVVLGTSQDANDNAVGGVLNVSTTGATEANITVTATFSLASFDSAELAAYLDVDLLKNGDSAISHFTVAPVLA